MYKGRPSNGEGVALDVRGREEGGWFVKIHQQRSLIKNRSLKLKLIRI